MSQQQTKPVNVLDKVDPVWARIRREAEVVVRQEPELSSFIYSSVLHHDNLEQVVVHRIAERLDHPDVSGELIRQAYWDALEDTPTLGDIFRADNVATYNSKFHEGRAVLGIAPAGTEQPDLTPGRV